MFRLLATGTLALAMIPAAAWAESNTMTGNPGFFKPTPDGEVALTKIEPATLSPNPSPKGEGSIPAPAERVREAEAEAERAEREHEKAAEKSVQSATRIEGAFTGLTSERDR